PPPVTAWRTGWVTAHSAVVASRSDPVLDAAQYPHHGTNHEDGYTDPQEELRSLHRDAQHQKNYSDNDQCKYEPHKK
ncbi:hypothetical protein, partial [Arthrobacter sp. 179]|uniref:hypothetical protein n=1 Tax=Arthrobacter sp. 179 TaxID=3457734 RepID=UPI0040338E41